MDLKDIIENQAKKLPQLEQNLKAIDDKMNRLIINRKYIYKRIKNIKKAKEGYDKANQTL